ncbi:MAG: serine hydrolase domain-containing protein [Saonia sp.]
MKCLSNLLVIAILLCFFSCSSDTTDIAEEPVSEGPEEPIDMEDPDPVGAELYFPPTDSNTWETTSIDALGWNASAEQPLLDLLEEKNTKAFILLKEGKIVIEAYFNGGSVSSNGPWNSAGKTLAAFTVGLAQQDGFLNLDDSSSDYLGEGWSSLSATDETKITIAQHITMTTGLDYNVSNTNCTDADCLTFLNEAGTFWYYHNAPYTLTQSIIAGAVNTDFDTYFSTKLKDVIGMDGAWISFGFATIYYSTARSMARFGLLNLNKGSWEDNPILTDSAYFDKMTTTSQDMNKAYGYLWWLNGKDSFRVPGSELQFPGKLIQTAPNDLIAGLGKDDQKLYVVPSEGLVVVRMGDNAGETLLGPSSFDTDLWQKINDLID